MLSSLGPVVVLGQSRQAPMEIWIWAGALIVASLVFGVVVMTMRRRLLNGSDSAGAPGAMLDELRAMRARGEISQSEYDHTRSSIAARAAGREPPPRPDAARGPEAPDGSVAARPGYDLTGERLPARKPDPGEPPSPGANTPHRPASEPED